MSDSKNLISEFYRNALQGGILSERDSAVAIVVSALARGDVEFVKKGILAAKSAGLSNNEIIALHGVICAAQAQHVSQVMMGDVTALASGKSTAKCCQ